MAEQERLLRKKKNAKEHDAEGHEGLQISDFVGPGLSALGYLGGFGALGHSFEHIGKFIEPVKSVWGAREAMEGAKEGDSFKEVTGTLEFLNSIGSHAAELGGFELAKAGGLGIGEIVATEGMLGVLGVGTSVLGAGLAGVGVGTVLDKGTDWIGDKITGNENADHSLSGLSADLLFDLIHGNNERKK